MLVGPPQGAFGHLPPSWLAQNMELLLTLSIAIGRIGAENRGAMTSAGQPGEERVAIPGTRKKVLTTWMHCFIIAPRHMAAMEPLTTSEDTVWLGEYLSVLRRRKWSILIVTLLAVLGALLYGQQQTPIYESTARVNATVVLQTGSSPVTPNMETEQAFVTSDDVTKCAYLLMQDQSFRANPTQTPDMDTLCSADALAATELIGPVRATQQNVTVTLASPSTVMGIAYDSPSARAAQVGAQAYALAYIHQRTLQATDQLNDLRSPLVKQQEDLSNKISNLNSKVQNKIDAIST